MHEKGVALARVRSRVPYVAMAPETSFVRPVITYFMIAMRTKQLSHSWRHSERLSPWSASETLCTAIPNRPAVSAVSTTSFFLRLPSWILVFIMTAQRDRVERNQRVEGSTRQRVANA